MGFRAKKLAWMLLGATTAALMACAQSGSRTPASDPVAKSFADYGLERFRYSVLDFSRVGMDRGFRLRPAPQSGGFEADEQWVDYATGYEALLEGDRAALDLMVSKGRLSVQDRDLYFAIGARLRNEPQRVTFVQASVREPVPFGELSEAVRARHAEFAAHALRKYPDTVVIGPVRDALAATVKVVRDWDPTSGNARALPLAEQFPEFARRRLDPAAINFEFSRCVNDGARELFRANLTVAAFVAARDVWDRGGNLDQAYVYLHTIVPETADHFAGQLPFEVVERLPGGHVILRRRLRDLIDELAPERVFADFRRAGEMLGISRSSDLAEFLHRARGLDWGDYDVVRADGRREGRLHWLAEKTLVRSRVRALLGRFSRYPLDLDRVLEYLDRSELKSWSRDPGPGDGVVRASLDAWLEGRTTYDAQAVAFGEKYLRDLVEAAGPGATRESAEAAFRALRFRFDGDGAEEGLARAMQGKVRRTRSLRLQLTGEQLLARMKRRVRRGEAITLEPRGAHVGSTDAILPFFRPAKPKGIRAPTR